MVPICSQRWESLVQENQYLPLTENSQAALPSLPRTVFTTLAHRIWQVQQSFTHNSEVQEVLKKESFSINWQKFIWRQKTQAEPTWYYLWSLLFPLNMNIHTFHSRNHLFAYKQLHLPCWGCLLLSHFSHVRLGAKPIDDSPPGSPIPGILQARTLEWGAISFCNAWKWKA